MEMALFKNDTPTLLKISVLLDTKGWNFLDPAVWCPDGIRWHAKVLSPKWPNAIAPLGTDTGGKQRDAAWWGDQIKYQKGGEKPRKIGGFGRKGQYIIDINEKLQTPTEKINALTE